MNDIAAEMLASQLADCVVYFDGDDCAGGLIQRAAVAELKRLQAKDYEFQTKAMDSLTDAFLERRWIPASERLPDQHQEVIGWWGDTPQPHAGFAWIDDNGVWNSDSDYPDPTHWMPLPEPPTN
jgi:hypothetical protein